MAINTWAKQSFTYRDNTGHTGRVSFWMGLDNTVGGANDMNTIAAGVKAAVDNLTNAKAVSAIGPWQGGPLDPSQYGAAADYANVEDKARFNFLANSRQRSLIFSVPAPLVSAFFSGAAGSGSTGGDRETIDPSQGIVAALLAAFQAASNTCVVTAGPFDDPIHSLVVGKLVRRKEQRKIGKWTKNPSGTTPA